MLRVMFMPAGAVLLAIALGMPAQAQQQQRPPQEATKVDGTDNVYIFRNGNHQAMFVVTKDGVIATDPVALASRKAASSTSMRSRRSPTSRSNM